MVDNCGKQSLETLFLCVLSIYITDKISAKLSRVTEFGGIIPDNDNSNRILPDAMGPTGCDGI
jgi:hypothetical protein